LISVARIKYDGNKSAIEPTGESFLPSLTRNQSPVENKQNINSYEKYITGFHTGK